MIKLRAQNTAVITMFDSIPIYGFPVEAPDAQLTTSSKAVDTAPLNRVQSTTGHINKTSIGTPYSHQQLYCLVHAVKQCCNQVSYHARGQITANHPHKAYYRGWGVISHKIEHLCKCRLIVAYRLHQHAVCSVDQRHGYCHSSQCGQEAHKHRLSGYTVCTEHMEKYF